MTKLKFYLTTAFMIAALFGNRGAYADNTHEMHEHYLAEEAQIKAAYEAKMEELRKKYSQHADAEEETEAEAEGLAEPHHPIGMPHHGGMPGVGEPRHYGMHHEEIPVSDDEPHHQGLPHHEEMEDHREHPRHEEVESLPAPQHHAGAQDKASLKADYKARLAENKGKYKEGKGIAKEKYKTAKGELKKAYEEGHITKAEYEAQKNELKQQYKEEKSPLKQQYKQMKQEHKQAYKSDKRSMKDTASQPE